MNILQIASKIPIPPKDGGMLLMYNFAKGYFKNGNDVTFASLNTKKHNVDLKKCNNELLKFCEFQSVNIDTSINPFYFIYYLFLKMPYNISRFHSKEFEVKLKLILEQKKYDVIVFEGLYVTSYLKIIRKYSNTISVLRQQNIEHKIWERLAKNSKNLFKKLIYSIIWKKIKNYELEIINSFDAIIPVTNVDAEYFKNNGCNTSIHVAEFCIDLEKYVVNKNDKNLFTLFHIGSMDWRPNQESILWFLESVWPKINLKFPDLRFVIAGKNMPDFIKNLKYKNVEILGEVEDAIEFINSHTVMVVPLLSGSGIRVKIIEAMALEKTIITTSIGAEGINYTDNKNIKIANSNIDFLNAISDLINNKTQCDEIGKNARKLVEKDFDLNVIVGNLVKFYQNLPLRTD